MSGWRNRNEFGRVMAGAMWQEAGDQAAAWLVCGKCGERVAIGEVTEKQAEEGHECTRIEDM